MAAKSQVLPLVRRCVDGSEGATHLIFEDIPTACFLAIVAKENPRLVVGVRSHNALIKAYGGLTRTGSLISRIGWRYELMRIAAFEKQVCRLTDFLWTISPDDSREYRGRLKQEPDGVVGVFLDVQRYRSVLDGDARTVVSVGTADLRKGGSVASFIRNCWPKVRAEVPDARLVLAGRGTERFTDPSQGILGTGFVDDDRDILRIGRIFINPQSIGSGIQLKSVVAMLAGKVLVTSRVGAEGIAGTDGKHFLVSGCENTMASQIVTIMRDHKMCSEIGENARQLASEVYSIECFEEQGAMVMRTFIGNSKSDR